VFGIGQLLEGMLITPWLVGDRIGLHPVYGDFCVYLAFGQLFGFSWHPAGVAGKVPCCWSGYAISISAIWRAIYYNS